MRRVMWIEDKSNGIVGPARIGWVEVRNGGKKLVYGERVFFSLRGRGFKANFAERETGTPFWISGCHKDGRDALYNTDVEIDEDALEEYWVNVRGRPQDVTKRRLRVRGKY